jgi:hypothetical protein
MKKKSSKVKARDGVVIVKIDEENSIWLMTKAAETGHSFVAIVNKALASIIADKKFVLGQYEPKIIAFRRAKFNERLAKMREKIKKRSKSLKRPTEAVNIQ